MKYLAEGRRAWRRAFTVIFGGLILTVWHNITLADSLDRIVAIAGEDIILASELQSAELEILRQLRGQGAPVPSEDDLRRQVLERLILTRLQTQRAQRTGISVSDEDINRALEMVAARNKLNQDEFRRALDNEGIDYNFYRQQLRDELLINRLRQREVDSRVTVTDRDVDLFLQAQTRESGQQYRIRQILIAVPPKADPETRQSAREKAESLLKELNKGADFPSLAQKESDGQQALEGGDLGWFEGHLLPTIFADTVPSLEPGELGQLLTSDSGFHIVKLEDVRAAGKRLIEREVHARHILLRPNEIRSPEETESLIKSLHKRLKDGDDFSVLAREYSDDPGSASEGGDLNWQPAENFEPRFSEEIQAIEAGELSEPFRSSFGWHIAEVIDWRERDTTNEQLRARARNLLRQRRTSEEYDRWLRRLRGDAYVEYRLPGMEDDSSS